MSRIQVLVLILLSVAIGGCASRPVDEVCYSMLEKEIAIYEEDGETRRKWRTDDFAEHLAAAEYWAHAGDFKSCIAHLDSARIRTAATLHGRTVVHGEKQHIDSRNGGTRARQ